MSNWLLPSLTLLSVCLAMAAVLGWRRRARRQAAQLADWTPPPAALARLQARRPGWDAAACAQVGLGLRQFLLAAQRSDGEHLDMPSRAAAELWACLAEDAAGYETLCRQALGGPLPWRDVQEPSGWARENLGLRHVWAVCCALEGQDPYAPTQVPLLFDLDRALDLPDGVIYALTLSPQPPAEGDRRPRYRGQDLMGDPAGARWTGGDEAPEGGNWVL
ncbi:hypothetical protein [Ideonella livida]|uniref:Uncharacterized protein n=1 Tax=Ideonella livida TaxID=2707176 RepID=A0A7C9TMB5_9BURK|nr:hypothetical protein [Ideonella livida]NDY93084.1 hypothetical protein [Ideonella livida]